MNLKNTEDWKEYLLRFIRSKDIKVYIECALNGKRIDVYCIKDSKEVLIECIVSQQLGEATARLIKFKSENTKLIICRMKKNRNPKARKVISKIERKGIILLEL